MRSVEHGECGVAINNQDFAVLLGEDLGARFDVVKNGVQLLSFDQRIGFHTSKSMAEPIEGSPFASAYFCRDFLPRDLIVEKLDKYDRPLIEDGADGC